MPSLSLFLAAALLLPLAGQEKGQAAAKQIPPSARTLNIALSEITCKGKNACGSIHKKLPISVDPEKQMYYIKYYAYPDGNCDSFDGLEKEVRKWEEVHCAGSISCLECLFVW
jgi:hypothetical protein